MSVLINMEMPTSCADCRLMADGWCYSVGLEQRKKISTVKRPTWCPLVPVPEPHGALMDRDDFFATCPELVDGYKCITDDLVVIPAEEGE